MESERRFRQSKAEIDDLLSRSLEIAWRNQRGKNMEILELAARDRGRSLWEIEGNHCACLLDEKQILIGKSIGEHQLHSHRSVSKGK